MEGTLVARCDTQENNFLALNLVYDFTKKKILEEARKAYSDKIKQAMSRNKPEYMMKRMFAADISVAHSDMNTI